MTLPENFLSWHAETNDSLDVKITYIDMADDLVAGVVLSQIVSWYLPNKDSPPRINEKGYMWFVKEHQECVILAVSLNGGFCVH